MTHISKFRYGEVVKDPPSGDRGSSEVRVSYFDPATGKPCKKKPKPLKVQREEMQTARERVAQRLKEEAEAAEIMANMRQRKAEKRRKGNNTTYGRGGKPVLVDGELFHSVTAAANEIGVDGRYLSKQLRAGAKFVHGRKVEYMRLEA